MRIFTLFQNIMLLKLAPCLLMTWDILGSRTQMQGPGGTTRSFPPFHTSKKSWIQQVGYIGTARSI